MMEEIVFKINESPSPDLPREVRGRGAGRFTTTLIDNLVF